MRADFKVVLDACVLANFSVCDLFLRLAETPRLYMPKWSAELLAETKKTQIESLKWDAKIAESFQEALETSFPESMVSGFEPIIESCKNHPKDRHVLACAIHSQAEVIATFNLKDFQKTALEPWRIDAMHPQDYLLILYSIDPPVVLHKLEMIARKRDSSLEDHLIKVGRYLPAFSQKVLEDISRTS